MKTNKNSNNICRCHSPGQARTINKSHFCSSSSSKKELRPHHRRRHRHWRNLTPRRKTARICRRAAVPNDAAFVVDVAAFVVVSYVDDCFSSVRRWRSRHQLRRRQILRSYYSLIVFSKFTSMSFVLTRN